MLEDSNCSVKEKKYTEQDMGIMSAGGGYRVAFLCRVMQLGLFGKVKCE